MKSRLLEGLLKIERLEGTFLNLFIGRVSCGYITTTAESEGESETDIEEENITESGPDTNSESDLDSNDSESDSGSDLESESESELRRKRSPKKQGNKPEVYQPEDILVVTRQPPVQEQIEYAPCRSLTHFEESVYVKWGNYQLSPYVHFVSMNKKMKNGKSKKVEKRYEKLTTFLRRYIQNIRQFVEHYMPEDELMVVVSALDQRKWPEDVESIASMPEIIDGFKNWPKIFQYDDISEEQMVLELNQFAKMLKEDINWCFRRLSSPTNFWNKLLIDGNLSDNMRKLIESTLTIPYGSADAERAFRYETSQNLHFSLTPRDKLSNCAFWNFGTR